MKKTETIEAIEKLIKKYKRTKYKNPDRKKCFLCKLYYEFDYCNECINYVFINFTIGRTGCYQRTFDYLLDHYDFKNYPNLVKFWTSVKNFLTPLEEEIKIADIKEHILKLAEPFKK